VPGDALVHISGEVQEQVARAASVLRDDPAPAQQALWVYGGAAIYPFVARAAEHGAGSLAPMLPLTLVGTWRLPKRAQSSCRRL
jgi:hypothetical protein